MKKELAESREALETGRAAFKLLSEAHHELRNPVHLIVIAAYNLERQLDALEISDKRALEAIKRAISRLSRTTDEISALCRLKAGALELKPKSIVPALIVEALIRSHEVLANQKNLMISWKNEVSDFTIVFDEFCFTQMIANLLSNAINFTDRGSVSLRLFTQNDGSLALEIHDTGIGMHDAFIPLLFKPFARESRDGRVIGGAGLGLALTQHYAELNNARISVNSRIGEGTTFTVSFSS